MFLFSNWRATETSGFNIRTASLCGSRQAADVRTLRAATGATGLSYILYSHELVRHDLDGTRMLSISHYSPKLCGLFWKHDDV
jgi:hypothetical protein